MISLILTIHNQEAIIQEVLSGIFSHYSSLCKEIIIVFDGCDDNSEKFTRNFMSKNFPQFPVTYQVTDNLFETKANNVALRLATQPYAIIIQDDCLIQERAFDVRLIKPMLFWGDLFAVTGRDAHDVKVLESGLVEYPNVADKARDFVHVRQVVNRGPLALKMEVVRAFDYLDETFYPQNGDDHDLCLRAATQGWHCGSYPIFFMSDPSWGGTRKGDGRWIADAIHKNMRILNNRYSIFLQAYNPMEERYLP